MKVVDVSTFQGQINWSEARKHIDGAIIRCGFGDDIGSQDDEQFLRNISECERLGIPHGVYLYSYATNEAHMQSEVNHVLRLISGRKLQFPVYIDLEDDTLRPYFNSELFCRMGGQIEKAGYWFGVYANLDWFRNTIGNSLDRFTRWVAQYNNTFDSYGDMWQYTSQGTVPGIGTGNVDMNECYRDFPREITGEKAQKPDANTPQPDTGRTKDLGGVDCIYQAYTDRWWPKVKNREDWAGAGDGEPIRYLGICVSKGSIRGRVYTEKNGWLPYLTFTDKYNINDLENGVLGDGSPIQAIELYYITPDGYTYKRVAYCVSDINHDIFYPVQYDDETGNGQDGYAGVFGVAVDKFQAWIE